ncbi:phototropic-responsive NPH3 family protein [Actinidia rufa]|uniref:Phototropic-responsive NPH3 family protein n=1 Tax=Actinidia rufa TaxID=165716 RepID=A0A7J0EZ31_9ERIC|nr:phototropic-responsive NPH3 family protein [Actinidia rufa]
MKFMKLGSRPDTFYTSEAVRSREADICFTSFLFSLQVLAITKTLLRKPRKLAPAPNSPTPDFPGGVEAFELCAKFCYGITITLSAYNIVSTRCAAEYLQMTEDVEKGNLIYKIEIFFNSCILSGWKDSIVTLQNTKAFPSWSEELSITSRCIEAIASKVLAHPSKVNLSHSYSRRGRDNVSCNGGESQRHNKALSKGWWAEELAELGIDLYWRTIIAIKSGGKIPSSLIGDALRVYASKWLPNISKDPTAKNQVESDPGSDSIRDLTSKHRLLLESIISLLPAERGSVSCSFLLKLLKAANIVNASSSSKIELARRIGLQLEEAKVGDLLIPSMRKDSLYDVDMVMTILEQFMLQGQSPPTSPPRAKDGFERRRRSRSAENVDFGFQESRRSSSASHSSKLKVGKIVDGYLQEIAQDVNLPLSKFIALAEAIPEFARLDHDDLYKAIDIYLKAHTDLNKSERKRLCRTLDCKKLSMEACMHAAQNELLPLRVVVQVLFFEQARAAMPGGQVTELPSNIQALLAATDDPRRPTASLSTNVTVPAEDQWSVSGLNSPKSKLSTLRMKLAEDEDLEENYTDGIGKSSKVKAICSIPTGPKRMFSKLWSINRSASEKN